MKEELIKSTHNLSKNEISILRERFLCDYSSKKGWDPKNLTTEQVLDIVSQPSYKTPGLIKG